MTYRQPASTNVASRLQVRATTSLGRRGRAFRRQHPGGWSPGVRRPTAADRGRRSWGWTPIRQTDTRPPQPSGTASEAKKESGADKGREIGTGSAARPLVFVMVEGNAISSETRPGSGGAAIMDFGGGGARIRTEPGPGAEQDVARGKKNGWGSPGRRPCDPNQVPGPV